VPEHGAVAVCSAILYDLDQDAILFEQNADVPIPPASLTKVLSMFLAWTRFAPGSPA
jgi:D-alanyl-D-alanine carboxypeptidase (penicillin-binding protein 5/6)